MRLIRVAAVLLALTGVAPLTAEAVVLKIDYSGIVTGGAGLGYGGLVAGDMVTGTYIVDTAKAGPDVFPEFNRTFYRNYVDGDFVVGDPYLPDLGSQEDWLFIEPHHTGVQRLSIKDETYTNNRLNRNFVGIEIYDVLGLPYDGLLEALVGFSYSGNEGRFSIYQTAYEDRTRITNTIYGDLSSFAIGAVSVPEPRTLSLLGAGLVAIGYRRRRSKTQT